LLPLPLALRSINAYLIEGSSGYALVDTGMHTQEAAAALRAGLVDAGIAIEDVRRVFVTHLHPDHLGMAGTLERAGAEIVMHGPELENASRMWSRDHSMIDETYAWFERHGMPAAVDEGMREAWLQIGRAVDEVERVTSAADGEQIDLGGRSGRLKWTPGHTDYHAVLVDEPERILFSGDHVLPRITSNVGLYSYSRDDPLGDFLDALSAVRTLPVTRVLPAHGDPFDDLPGRVDQILAHHEERLRATLDAIGDGERDAYTVCRKLFPVLRSAHEERFALAETLAHLRYLERREKVREGGDKPARWAVL
jgi:glyoxylase-like metal-dependent hydrolase (beta-lactamase superfamily II)